MTAYLQYRGVSRPVEVRFWEKVRRNEATGCWEWIAARDDSGYGLFHVSVEAGRIRSHTWAYEAARGPVPAGLHLDHLCENKACCNPWHLEPVTVKENVRRGPRSRLAWARTTCEWGHSLDDVIVHHGRDGSTRRKCRECNRVYSTLYSRLPLAERARRKAAGLPIVDLGAVFAPKAVA